jgi:hypothetical protein
VSHHAQLLCPFLTTVPPHHCHQEEAHSPHSLPTRSLQSFAPATQVGTSDPEIGGADGEFRGVTAPNRIVTSQPLPHGNPGVWVTSSRVCRTPTQIPPLPISNSPVPAPGSACAPESAQHRLSPPAFQVSELRQQLRLRGLPVSGTKSMLLERMRGGAPPRERPKPRREDKAAGAPWPRLRPKARGTAKRLGPMRAGLDVCIGPMRGR